jgi:hypothetical protein
MDEEYDYVVLGTGLKVGYEFRFARNYNFAGIESTN